MLSQQVGDRFTTAYALNGLGLVKQSLGEFTEAQQLLEDSISIWREIGDLASMAQSLNNLGYVFLAMDRPLEAQNSFSGALSVAKNAGLLPVILDALMGDAEIRSANGELMRAYETAWIVSQHSASSHVTRTRADIMCANIEKQLPQSEVALIKAKNNTVESMIREIVPALTVALGLLSFQI
jgi:tetratricopeptide (TPR) repeat protein